MENGPFISDFSSYKPPILGDFPASHVWLPEGNQQLKVYDSYLESILARKPHFDHFAKGVAHAEFRGKTTSDITARVKQSETSGPTNLGKLIIIFH